jgi:hypothetical protein
LVTATYWKWWRSTIGWTVAAMDILLMLTFMLPSVGLIFGIDTRGPDYRWYTLGVLALVQPTVVWRAYVLFRRQQLGRYDPEVDPAVPAKPEPAEPPEPPVPPAPASNHAK